MEEVPGLLKLIAALLAFISLVLIFSLGMVSGRLKQILRALERGRGE